MSGAVTPHIQIVGTTRKRCTAVMTAMALFALYLSVVIFRLEVSSHEEYAQKVLDQITTSSFMKAKRGTIYDREMNVLAANKTVWRIFLTPVDIAECSDDDHTDYARIIAEGLSEILTLSSDTIESKARQSRTIDVTLEKDADEETYRKVQSFISANGLEKMVHTEATVSRYYPEGSLAAHVIGFTGADNQGLFGLEYAYDSLLAGENGSYVYAKDARGNEMPGGYIDYVEAVDGCSLVTTIDLFMQKQLEYTLSEIEQTFAVQNRVTGIVMETTTGAILAMATSDGFDLNSPYDLNPLYQKKLSDMGLTEGTEEYRQKKNEFLYTMWQNKPVSEAYEPGSTFKIITVSAGLETGAVSLANRYTCKGSYAIGGYHISCHKRGGHGNISLAEGLQQSCNPAMIQISQATGTEAFYRYVSAFGYLEKTGIDLPSEGTSIFHKEEKIGPTELATASFGQRFKITPLQQITAISAVANGGFLLTPYTVEKAIDATGNIVYEHQTNVRRQVISAETAQTVAAILEEGVSGNGGAKNAAVPGYKIAAKTGTSEKFDILDENGNSYLRIGSCIGFAPSDNARIAILIVVDEPTTAKYGSMVAAPYVADLMEVYLPYLGYENSDPAKTESVTVGQYTGLKTDNAQKEIQKSGLKADIVGCGDTVIRQTPACGTEVSKSTGKVILFTEGYEQTLTTVPDLIGKTASECNDLILRAGLNICLKGARNLNVVEGATAQSQSYSPGSAVEKGTVIEVRFLFTDDED